MTRSEAVERGRRYGTETATQMNEVGAKRDGRIRRALEYAVWEFDGKPSGLTGRDGRGATASGDPSRPVSP